MHRTVSPIALPCVIGGVGLWGIAAAATASTTTPTKTSTAATAAPATATAAATAAITTTRPCSEAWFATLGGLQGDGRCCLPGAWLLADPNLFKVQDVQEEVVVVGAVDVPDTVQC
jgi:hypothetical protein